MNLVLKGDEAKTFLSRIHLTAASVPRTPVNRAARHPGTRLGVGVADATRIPGRAARVNRAVERGAWRDPISGEHGKYTGEREKGFLRL